MLSATCAACAAARTTGREGSHARRRRVLQRLQMCCKAADLNIYGICATGTCASEVAYSRDLIAVASRAGHVLSSPNYAECRQANPNNHGRFHAELRITRYCA